MTGCGKQQHRISYFGLMHKKKSTLAKKYQTANMKNEGMLSGFGGSMRVMDGAHNRLLDKNDCRDKEEKKTEELPRPLSLGSPGPGVTTTNDQTRQNSFSTNSNLEIVRKKETR